MKVAIIGATGFLGTHLVNEFASRNHDIIAISRKDVVSNRENVRYITADVFNIKEMAETLSGCDAVVSAYNPGWTNPDIYNEAIAGSRSLQEAVRQSGVKRYIYIGGAGSLFLAPGLQLIDTPEFPEEYKAGASAARDYLEELKKEDVLDWVFFSPAIEMHRGITTGRTATYRTGLDSPVLNDEGRSILSGEDVAVVIADEAEIPKFHQQRFTAAY